MNFIDPERKESKLKVNYYDENQDYCPGLVNASIVLVINEVWNRCVGLSPFGRSFYC